jgi:hypothetical protein
MTLKEMVERNRKWLRFYSVAACIIGWGAIISACVGQISLILYLHEKGEIFSPFCFAQGMSGLYFAFWGGVALLAAQFLDFLLAENKVRPKWLLRNGDKLLYFTVIIAVCSLMAWIWLEHTEWPEHIAKVKQGRNSAMIWLFFSEEMLTQLFRGINILALFYLVQGFRRIFPVVERYKSLV